MSDKLDKDRSCWIWHTWSAWSEPQEGKARWMGGEWERAVIQSRTCKDCNKQELRGVR